jgi:hypothetical protein
VNAAVARRALALCAMASSGAMVACDGSYTSLGKQRAADDAATTPPQGSGLPWPSGTNVRDSARLESFRVFRGSAADVALVLTDYSTWAGVTQPDALLAEFSGFAGRLVVAQPFWPYEIDGSLAECAAGDYDAHWTRFGETLSAHGRGDSIVRLAWQFNGDDVPWAATSAGTWIACYRRVTGAIREAAPRVWMDWSMNAHGTSQPAGGDAFDVYPGDEFVDVVGIDAYDMTPSSPDRAAWDAQCNGKQGLCQVVDFARAHGKRVGVGQWAVVTCNGFGDAGGDNPFFVEKMHEAFTTNADVMAYETYYNDPNPREFCTSLFEPVEAPRAAARYAELF